MIYTRDQIAEAVHYWGQHGTARGELALTAEASKLVDILGTMDYEKADQVQVGDETPRGKLISEAAAAVAAAEDERRASERPRSGM